MKTSCTCVSVCVQLLFCASMLFAAPQAGRGPLLALERITKFECVREDLFLYAAGMVPLPGDRLAVTDKLGYSLKILGPDGKVITSIGKRGNAPGEFSGEGPGDIAYANGHLAVADFASTRIQVFDADLKPTALFYAPGPVCDLQFDRQGRLWVGACTGDEKAELFTFGADGALLGSTRLKNSTGDLYNDVFRLGRFVDDLLMVSFITRNRVEIWNAGGEFINQFIVPGVADAAPDTAITSTRWLFWTQETHLPLGRLFMSCAPIRANVFLLLAGEYSAHPFRDTYILDEKGNCLSRFLLPIEAFKILVEGDMLYVIDKRHTGVTKYRIRRLSERRKEQ